MSDTGGGGTPTSTPAATATPAPAGEGTAAAPTPGTGPRRAAPGLSSDRSGMTLTQGIAALRRGGGTDAAPTTTATPAAPAAPPRRPATRAAPNTPAAAAGDGQQPTPPQRQAAAPAQERLSPLDTVMASFLPAADGTPPPQQQQQRTEPQPAPTNAYLQGVPLRIGNEERHFTLPELTEAVGKASDYTRKTAALAEQQRALNERAQTIDQLLPVLIPEIERQLAAMNGSDEEPKWAQVPPGDYQRVFAEWRERQQNTATERARLTQIMQANQQRETQQRIERVRVSHGQLVRTVPGWGDANTRGQLVAEMRTWGGQHGFPSAELDSIVEARHVETMLKAMMFDRIVANARTTTLNVPQVRRGNAPTPPAPAALNNAEERFNANPTNKTGVGLLLARRGQGRMNGRA
jgi:hypothetical protein